MEMKPLTCDFFYINIIVILTIIEELNFRL